MEYLTTIVCNKNEMACDLQFTLGGTMKSRGLTKIYKIKSHELHFHEEFIIGFCGGASEIIDVIDFYERPELYKGMPKTKSLGGLVLTSSGHIFQFDNPGRWIKVNEKFAAMGSGSPAAYGALYSGATPKQAIQAAMKVDPFTGMGTKVLHF